jgi:hypothetical protein
MKKVIRVGLVMVPFIFLISTTAYPAGAPGHHHNSKHKHGRSPSSVSQGQAVKLGEIPNLENLSQATPIAQPQGLQMASGARGVVPPIGSGIGVTASIFSW